VENPSGSDPLTSETPRRLRLCAALVAVAFVLFAAACSGSTEDTTAPNATDIVGIGEADEPQADPPSDAALTEAPEENASTPAPDCDALSTAFQRLRGASLTLPTVEDESGLELLLDIDVLLTELELFRPHQDVDAVPFGPIRDGLDNLEHDLIAAREGRFAEMTGDYQQAGMSGLLGTICS